jgi:galactonate dehydratase
MVRDTDAIEALISVAEKVPVRVIAGERMHDLHDFVRFLAADVTDVINPEPLGVGGIRRSIQIAGLARAHHAELALHNAESPLKTMIAIQICAVTSNIFIQECFDDFLEPWTEDVLHGYLQVENGHLQMPTAPGLGVELDEEEAKKHPYSPKHFPACSAPAGNAGTWRSASNTLPAGHSFAGIAASLRATASRHPERRPLRAAVDLSSM